MAALTEPGALPAPRPSSLGRLARGVPPAVWSLALLLLIWEVSVHLFGMREFVLPAPSRILAEIAEIWPRLVPNALVTLSEVLIGFALAVAIGIPLAVLIVYSSLMERAVYPLIVISQTIPKVAVAPLLLTWFGYGMTPKYVIVVLLSFFPIVINTVMGLKASSDEMLHLARSMGSSGLQTFWKFRLPQALPSIFAGLKLATVLSVIGATVAEFVGSDRGLGYMILIAGSNFDVPRQFAAILVLSGIGMVFFFVLGRVERAALPWRRPAPMGSPDA